MSLAICIEGLEKSYRRSWTAAPVAALRGVSLCVDAGEAFGFVGPNGAGKSTTIKVLMGLIRASRGTARIFDLPVDQPLARQGVGYVPENPYLQDYLTPLEVLAMGARLHRVEIADLNSHCRVWLERLGLGHVANKAIRTFSKGMAQRVALAHALCLRPRLLILDEPLSGLDPVGRRDVVEILAEYKRSGGTLLFTSHVLHDVERLADRFGLIHEGLLRAVRGPAELAGGDEQVQVRSIGTQLVQGMREDFSGRWIGEVPQAALWERLEALNKAGHILLEVRPALSLEVAFMRAIGHA